MMRADTINNPQIHESPIIRTEYNGVQVTIVFDETAEGTRSRKESESRQALPDDTAEWDQVLVAGSGGTDQEQEPGSADDAAKTLTHLAPPPTIRTSDEAAATRP